MKKLMIFFAVVFLMMCFSLAQSGPEPIGLQWSPSPSSDILAGYNMYRSEVSGGEYVKINTELIPATGAVKETFFDNNIEWNTTYYYVCRAVSLWDVESVDSNEAWEVRTAPAPEPTPLLEIKKN